MQRKRLNKTASLLINELLDRGFVIQRYDAYSTSSIYLKLDYGVCNSIRIGDHPGKKYLNYRYNIGPCTLKPYRTEKPYTRYFYPEKMVYELIQLIEAERSEKLLKYGERNYRNFMKKNREQGKGKQGFWQQARLIERRKTACS